MRESRDRLLLDDGEGVAVPDLLGPMLTAAAASAAAVRVRGDRRAQLVRGVRHELTLHGRQSTLRGDGRLEASEQVVERDSASRASSSRGLATGRRPLRVSSARCAAPDSAIAATG